MLQSQYHCCWWPGDERSQVISSNVIDIVLAENSNLSIRQFKPVTPSNPKHSSPFPSGPQSVYFMRKCVLSEESTSSLLALAGYESSGHKFGELSTDYVWKLLWFVNGYLWLPSCTSVGSHINDSNPGYGLSNIITQMPWVFINTKICISYLNLPGWIPFSKSCRVPGPHFIFNLETFLLLFQDPIFKRGPHASKALALGLHLMGQYYHWDMTQSQAS